MFIQTQGHPALLQLLCSAMVNIAKQPHRLREHGFIVQDAGGLWHLRVPLFERWLTAFDRIDLD